VLPSSQATYQFIGEAELKLMKVRDPRPCTGAASALAR
jgi:hypothetical protein